MAYGTFLLVAADDVLSSDPSLCLWRIVLFPVVSKEEPCKDPSDAETISSNSDSSDDEHTQVW